MKKIIAIIFLTITNNSFCQVVKIDANNKTLNTNQLNLDKSTYLVYFQNKSHTPKYNIEVWDREVTKTNNDTYNINWLRQNHKTIHKYTILVNQNFQPISEEIVTKSLEKNKKNEVRKYYHFKNNKVYSDQDTIKHNQTPFTIENTALAFNWELDLETLSMLPLEDNNQFDINFYHPGSKTKPKYYTYKKVREEKVSINKQEFNCWVLKIDHNEKQWSEFWIDKKTKKVLQMHDFFYGRFRYKKLVI